MTEIRPIRPWRYNEKLFTSIDENTSPLFDVVSEKQRQTLYQNPYNSIHLSVPQQPGAAIRAGLLLKEWKEKKILVQDKLPGIYVYYQYFKLPGSMQAYCRKGFVIHIRAYHWEEGVVLRHENTIPKAVNDRTELLQNTGLHVSATHGLYTDERHVLEPYMDEAIQAPLYETEDYQGVKDVLAVIHDAQVIRLFMDTIKPKKIILADGHHRYESSLAYREECKRANPNHHGDEGYNFHLMYLTNTESDDIKILPTHRLINGLRDFDQDTLIKKLEQDFTIKPVEEAHTLAEVIAGKPWAFGLMFQQTAYKIRLKPEALSSMRWPFPEVIKKLDLTVMHYFIIEKALGISGKNQRKSEHISFDRSLIDCLKKVIQQEAQLAIITNEVTMDDVKSVCHSGYTMPQKSTYFYPKSICGFLFSSINEDEFKTPIYNPF